MKRFGVDLALSLVLLAAFGGLWAFLERSNPANSAREAMVSVWVGWLLWPPFALAVLAAPWRGKPRWWRILFGMVLAGAGWGLAAHQIVGDRVFGGDALFSSLPGGLGGAFWAISAAYLLALGGALAAEAACLRNRSAGLGSLMAAYLIIIAPFCLDGFIRSNDDALLERDLSARVASLSPPSVLAEAVFGVDVLHEEEVYRRFRIAEQLLPPRDVFECFWMLATASGALFLLAGLVIGGEKWRQARQKRQKS